MRNQQDSFWLRIIYIVSIIILLVIAFLILGPRPNGIESTIDVSNLPLTNAVLNAITTILLLFGFNYIRKGNMKMHKIMMLSSFGTSSMFLITFR